MRRTEATISSEEEEYLTSSEEAMEECQRAIACKWS